ncbi:MAG TPA: hypothetical protein V6D47_05770 [Oscillatoriaceae cyanobacterium]
MSVGYNVISAVTRGADYNWNGYLDSNEATVSGSVDNSYRDVSVSSATNAIDAGNASIKDFQLDASTAKSVAQQMANYDAWVSKDDLYLSPAARSYVDGMAGGAEDNRISVSEMTAALERGGLALTRDGLYRDYEVGGYDPAPPPVDPNPPYDPTPPYVDPNPPYDPTPPYVDPNPPYVPAPPPVDPNPPYVPTPPSVNPDPPSGHTPPPVDPRPPVLTPKPTHKPAPKPAPKPTHKPAPKPTHKPTPKPTHKPAPKPTHKPAPKPVTKPAPKPTSTTTPKSPLKSAPAPAKAADNSTPTTTHENWFMRLIHAIF